MYKQPITANNHSTKLEKRRFQEAVTFLKKTKIHKHGKKQNLYTADWYLVIGTPQAGKTSLLKNSDIHFYLSRKNEALENHQEINWWVSKNAVYLDMPSCYSQSENSAHLNLTNRLIKKYAYQKKLRGILLVINIKDLLETNPDTKKITYASLNTLLENIIKRFHYQVPIFLIINKCDLLSGFHEFFSSFAKDERQQTWGFSLPQHTHGDREEILGREFDNLIARINQQLIWRLHHEPDVDKRNAIKDFPVQLAHIKSSLLDFVKLLTAHWEKSTLSGCYLTSASQTVSLPHHQTTPNALLMRAHTPVNKGYFIHDLLSHAIPSLEIPLKKMISPTMKRWPYYVIGLGVTLVIIFLAADYYRNHEQFVEASNLLNEYKLQDPLNPNLAIQANEIHYLTLARELLKPHDQWRSFLPSENERSVLTRSVDQLYDQQLNHFLIPQIKQSLENALGNDSTDPATRYAALRSYLMLTSPGNTNTVYLYHTLVALWQQKLATQAIGELSLPQLQTIMQRHSLLANVNTQLVDHARYALTQLPANELATAIIKSHFIDAPTLTLDLRKSKQAASLFTFRDPQIGIPGFYTLSVYKQCNSTMLTDAATSAIKGDAILGVINNQSNLSVTQLTAQLHEEYILDYAKAWQAFLDNIQIKSFQNLNDLHTTLNYLNSPSSPLTQLIHLLEANIPQEAINTSEELSALANVEKLPNQDQNLEGVNRQIAALDLYLKDSNNPAAIFKLTKERFLNNGQNDPITGLINLSTHHSMPLQNWLYQIGINTWQLMLGETKEYIFQLWKENLFPQYLAQINNRYPFNTNASNDVSIDSFVNFFSSNGLLDQFFADYLQAFIDTNIHPWKLKSLNGVTLPIRQTTLHSFGHAHFLRRLFFPNHDKHLYLPFTVLPTEFSNNLQTVTIKLGAQQITFAKHTNNTPFAFAWPDEHDANSLTLLFDNKNGEPNRLNLSGPWGWWRLLQNNDVTKTDQVKHWVATIQDNDDTLQLLIGVQQKFNPFDMNVFSHFKMYPEI